MTKTNDIQTKHSEITRYWLDKVINKRGKIYNNLLEAMNENELHHTVEITDGLYTPCCWACRKPIIKTVDKLERLHAKYSLEESDEFIDDFLDSKQATQGLYRCHIKSPKLGGKDEPDNFFLLCFDCKVESPNTSNPETFIRWVYNRRKEYILGFPYKAVSDGIEKELKQRGLGLTYSQIMERIEFDMDDYKDFLDKNIAHDRIRPGSSIPISTAIGVTTDYILSKLDKTKD